MAPSGSAIFRSLLVGIAGVLVSSVATGADAGRSTLSRPGGSPGGAVLCRQRDRSPRPHHRRETRRTLGPAVDRGEPSRHPRNRERGEVRTGRIHVDAHIQRTYRCRRPQQEPAVRSGTGILRRDAGRLGAAGFDRATQLAGNDAEGTGRAGQGQTGCAQLCFIRPRQHGLHLRRTVQADR